MELKWLKSKGDTERFIRFAGKVYQGNRCFRDGMSPIVRMFLNRQTVYLQDGEIFPFWVSENNHLLLRGAYIVNSRLPGVLMLAFFEALPQAKAAVDLMLTAGKELAVSFNCHKMIIGLDGHLNYGVGFLASHFDETPCFGFPYTPPYYLDYFRGLQEHPFTSFLADIRLFHLAGEEKILRRLDQHGYRFRVADFRHFPQELKIYTDLNNACFQDHLWWFNRTYAEDYELLNPFRWLIRGENLIIAEKKGHPIGFMLWYPDFNQLIRPGHGIGLATLLRSRLGLDGKMDRIKIAEVAVRHEFKGSGAVAGLFAKLYELVKDRYRYCEAGWVEESNTGSMGLGLHWEVAGCREHKKYKAFQINL